MAFHIPAIIQGDFSQGLLHNFLPIISAFPLAFLLGLISCIPSFSLSWFSPWLSCSTSSGSILRRNSEELIYIVFNLECLKMYLFFFHSSLMTGWDSEFLVGNFFPYYFVSLWFMFSSFQGCYWKVWYYPGSQFVAYNFLPFWKFLGSLFILGVLKYPIIWLIVGPFSSGWTVWFQSANSCPLTTGIFLHYFFGNVFFSFFQNSFRLILDFPNWFHFSSFLISGYLDVRPSGSMLLFPLYFTPYLKFFSLSF